MTQPQPNLPDTPDVVERDWARSGVIPLTGHAGLPIVPPGSGATWARRCTDLLREASGGTIDVDGAVLLGERAAVTRMRRGGRVAPGGNTRLLPTSNGWAAISCSRPDDPALYGALISGDIDAADPWPPIKNWVTAHTGAELDERAELLGLAAHSVSSSAHEVSRLVACAPHTSTGVGGTVGEGVSTSRLRCELASLETSRADSVRSPRGALRSPKGLRVVDFSALWAGPLCAHLLGLGGAEIIKVETTTRPDGARRGNADFYNLLHGGHRSVVFDPADDSDRRSLAELVASADIVIEASRPRALRGFGIDAEKVAATGVSWVSITAFGRDSNRIGFGDDVAAAAGLVALDDAGDPVFCGDAIADPLTGLTAVVWALTEPVAVLDLSMADIVGATLTGEPSAACVHERDGWVTPAGHPVVAPTPRAVQTPAPESGADTAAVFGEL